ncbi:hypothetical protein AGDE_13125 [Angomonas deanei]|uniref:Uncharacterized protein n=1 Tax=Angomonas deanei TaxID=59799 RepID=A0A7G2CFD0_9TRYP|nr:hypothetical protein AGDE_13125 [Angomonas deanei]CAD2218608.1 hypothetical protein, conserved [Angomonas deanei]|eukprot:EPY22778.1 hypothetical protein AGDE_13125 [Angomonas deanei]
MASSSVVQNVRKAFMFMPGAMEINGDVEIVVSATIQQENATGPTTFRRIVHVDPLLTLLSRQGPAKKHESKSNQTKEDFYAIGVVAGVTVVLVVTVIFFMLADNNRPLPKWIPRGKLVKQTVFSVLPGGKKKLEKVKPVVHKDMYDAMKSGKY